MTRIGILGAKGRMGRAIAQAADELGASISGGIDQEGMVHGAYSSLIELATASDVLVDFTRPEALAGHLEAAVTGNCPIVIGTTGLTPDDHIAIDTAAQKVPVLQAANTSLGVNLLAYLVREAAARLGPDWDIEILEMHHRHKVDAPSGTALLLGDAAAKGRGVDLVAMSDRGRDGITGARRQGAIGFAALRGGSVAGDHMVVLASEGERIELGHRAESRAIFAHGAVKAALWLQSKPAGRYTMNDVLGL